jgi:hypothetical protein
LKSGVLVSAIERETAVSEKFSKNHLDQRPPQIGENPSMAAWVSLNTGPRELFQHKCAADAMISGYLAGCHALYRILLDGNRKIEIHDFLHAPILPLGTLIVELFARATRPGWSSWGNETEKFSQ